MVSVYVGCLEIQSFDAKLTKGYGSCGHPPVKLGRASQRLVGPWRVVIERFNLDDETKLEGWFTVIDSLLQLGWASPAKIAQIPSGQFAVSVARGADPAAAARLWKASIFPHADLASASLLTLNGASGNAEKLSSRLKHAPACQRGAMTDVARALRP